MGTLARALASGRRPDFFSMVRNPYVRVLSAYLNKIASRGIRTAAGTAFCNRFGLPVDGGLSFRSFLQLLTFEAPECQDTHFAPQVMSLMTPYLPLDRLYWLEEAEPLWDWLLRLSGAPEAALEPGNRQDTQSRLEQYYDDTCIRLVRRLYADDFAAFGYSTDFSKAAEPPVSPPAASAPQALREPLLRLMLPHHARLGMPDRNAEALLDMVAPLVTDRVSPDWLDVMRMKRRGLDGPGDADRAEEIATQRASNWRLLLDLELVCAATQPRLAARISALRLDALLLHRDFLTDLPFAESPAMPTAGEAA